MLHVTSGCSSASRRWRRSCGGRAIRFGSVLAACIILMQQTLLTFFLQALEDCFFAIVLRVLVYQHEGLRDNVIEASAVVCGALHS